MLPYRRQRHARRVEISEHRGRCASVPTQDRARTPSNVALPCGSIPRVSRSKLEETVAVQRSEERGSGGFALTVVSGPDRGTQFSVAPNTPSRLLVGQGPACECRLTDPTVSRRHAAVVLDRGTLHLQDLGSTNGTEVNGIRVAEAWLRGGERICIGGTVLEVGADDRRAPASDVVPRDSFGKTVGSSDAMQRLYPLCERLAATTVSVIIEGETGTGKEVLAESIHEMGSRRDQPFVVFDCTTVAPSLIESSLFGHERGSFTGAVAQHRGVFEQAHKGTLLIDEIGDLPIELQPKLLRALQRGEVTRVGGTKSVSVDVRVLSATRRDLDEQVQAGRFRDDLFFRLAVARIELPPLRTRVGDVELLSRRFWTYLGGDEAAYPEALLASYASYSWPGNVRELYNAIARVQALGEGPPMRSQTEQETTASATLDFMDSVLSSELPLIAARQRVVDEFERRYVEHMVEKHGGNVSRAAAAAGIARRYFQILRARKVPPPIE